MRPESKPIRKPGPAAVIVGSVALFAVLFALIAFQLGAGTEQTQTTAAARETSVTASEPELDADDGYYAESPYEYEAESSSGAEEAQEVEEAPSVRTGGS